MTDVCHSKRRAKRGLLNGRTDRRRGDRVVVVEGHADWVADEEVDSSTGTMCDSIPGS